MNGLDVRDAINQSKSSVALFAALCFAVLASLHLARPISLEPDPVLLGFSVEDICGYSDTESHCPNCVLAVSAALSQPPQLSAPFQAEGVRNAVRFEDAPVLRVALTPYLARSPPFFL